MHQMANDILGYCFCYCRDIDYFFLFLAVWAPEGKRSHFSWHDEEEEDEQGRCYFINDKTNHYRVLPFAAAIDHHHVFL